MAFERSILTLSEQRSGLDIEMDPVPGCEMANWEKGHGDFAIASDLATLRAIPSRHHAQAPRTGLPRPYADDPLHPGLRVGEDRKTVARQCATSVERLERSYSFAIDLEDEGPKPAEEERRRARQLALSAAKRRQPRVA